MRDFRDFNSQFAETTYERNKRLAEARKRRAAEVRKLDDAGPITKEMPKPNNEGDLA